MKCEKRTRYLPSNAISSFRMLEKIESMRFPVSILCEPKSVRISRSEPSMTVCFSKCTVIHFHMDAKSGEMLFSYKWFHIPLEANYHVPLCLAFITWFYYYCYYYYHWPALRVERRRGHNILEFGYSNSDYY